MAQATKSTRRKSPSANGSKPKASAAGKKTSAARKKTSASGRKAQTKRASAKPSRSRSASAKSNGAATLPEAAVKKTKSAGHAVAEAAAKAKTPLIAGGTAIAGVAAGAAMKSRMGLKRSKNPIKRMKGMTIPKSAAKLDLKSVQAAGERVSAYGRQASEIAAAMEKTRKKNG